MTETTASTLAATALRCEALVDPVAIGYSHPLLTWIVESPERGQRQTAYEIGAASSAERLAADDFDLWHSGKVTSAETLGVEYGTRAGPGGTVLVEGARVGQGRSPVRMERGRSLWRWFAFG